MAERFTYFAYGSNMFTARLRARTPSATATGIGYILGYTLTFDKASNDGSSKCTIVRTNNPSDSVYGVLFEIENVERPELDRFEGLGKGYDDEEVSVITSDGEKRAATYIGTRRDASKQPYDWYREFVIRGAKENGLPDSVIRSLETVHSVRDSDTGRSARNWAILNGA